MSCECDECGEHILDCICENTIYINLEPTKEDALALLLSARTKIEDHINDVGCAMSIANEAMAKIHVAINILKETVFKQEGKKMDKQIKKVEKDLKKGEKDTKKLLKMDKKFDKKLEKCKIIKKKKK